MEETNRILQIDTGQFFSRPKDRFVFSRSCIHYDLDRADGSSLVLDLGLKTSLACQQNEWSRALESSSGPPTSKLRLPRQRTRVRVVSDISYRRLLGARDEFALFIMWTGYSRVRRPDNRALIIHALNFSSRQNKRRCNVDVAITNRRCVARGVMLFRKSLAGIQRQERAFLMMH